MVFPAGSPCSYPNMLFSAKKPCRKLKRENQRFSQPFRVFGGSGAVFIDKSGACGYHISGDHIDQLICFGDAMLYTEAVDLYKKLRLMHYRRLFGRIHERDGSLSATEAFAVDVIYLLGRPTLGEFAAFIGISQPNATYKVNNLMAKGYVEKQASESDRRECRLCVTDKFRDYYGERKDFIRAAVDKLMDEFSEQELDIFEKVLLALTDALE